MYSQPRIGLPSLSVFVQDELFTFTSLQFDFAVEIFKWVTAPSLTIRGPCIVIYSCNKTNEIHSFLKFTFWNRTLHVSVRFFAHHQESSTVYTAMGVCHRGYADCLLASNQPNQYLLLCV